MNDDVKVLREAAAKFEDEALLFGSGRYRWMYVAQATLCRRMADMIDSEKIGEVVSRAYPDDALKAAEDRGWNAAIAACWDIALGNGPVPPTWSLEAAQSPLATKAVQDMSVQVANAIRALRRGSQA